MAPVPPTTRPTAGRAAPSAERRTGTVTAARTGVDAVPGTRRAVRWAGVALTVQLVAMLAWSTLLYSRYAVTADYALRIQGWWGIAHGALDPAVSSGSRLFWQDHFELINWPLAPLLRLWPGGLWPLWIQDVMVAAGELGAVLLVADATRRPGWSPRLPSWVAVGLVTVLLVANPWTYESISFDFHYQSVGAACFAMLACREMVLGRRRPLLVWVVLCLACGDIAGTYLAAVGAGGVLVGRTTRRRGAVLAAVGAAWFLLVSRLGGGKGSSLARHYTYLAGHVGAHGAAHLGAAALLVGLVTHPVPVAHQLWQARDDLWAYVSSAGILGLASPLAVLPGLVLFEGASGSGGALRSIAYESFGAFLFLAPLSVLVLSRWASRLATPRAARVLRGPLGALRWRRLPVAVAALLAVNALLWAAVWLPRIPGQWLRTSPAAASALTRAEALIPPGAEVVASQGIMGRFCERRWCYGMVGGPVQRFPVDTGEVDVLVAPYAGVETASVQDQLGVVADLAGPLHAHLLLARAGIWLFAWDAPAGSRSLTFRRTPTLPAWAMQTATGAPVLVGPAYTWNMALRATPEGYLLHGADWDLLPGRWEATVTVAAAVPVSVEVWDASTDTLLARRLVPATVGPTAVQLPVRVTSEGGDRAYRGWGPFSFLPTAPPSPADRIEVRVWSDGAGTVHVYDVEVEVEHGGPVSAVGTVTAPG